MTAATTSLADQAITQTVERALAKYPQHAARIRRAAALLDIDAVKPLGAGRYSVRSQANASESYLVVMVDGKYATCGCQDFARQGKGCKHQWAAHLYEIAAERYERLVENARPVAPAPELWSPEDAKRLLFARWLAARNMIGEG
jgi:hypothetical protein